MHTKLFAKKSLGQNFLIQPHIITEIVTASGASQGETIIEIGPGTGLLTEKLLETGATVIAIEKDTRLIETLTTKFQKEIEAGTFTLIHEDVLETTIQPNEPYRIVANIPYYITGKILRLFLAKERKPISMTLMLQKEVAERIVSKNTKESVLSVSVKAYGTPHYVRTVKAGNFAPAPKVDSAILHISDISDEHFAHTSEAFFFDVLHAGFNSKRKKLFKNLKSYNKEHKLEHVFDTCGIDKGLRAEDLTVTNWVCLAQHLH